jgi:hypothetical protein
MKMPNVLVISLSGFTKQSTQRADTRSCNVLFFDQRYCLVPRFFRMRHLCHTGYAHTATSLLAEETICIAVRMFEDRQTLLTTMAKQQKVEQLQSRLQNAQIYFKYT